MTFLRDLVLALGPELTIVTAIVFGGLAIVAAFHLLPLSFAWMHEALGDEPPAPAMEDDLEDDEQRAVAAARRARVARLDAFRLRGGLHVVDAGDPEAIRGAIDQMERRR